MRPILQWILHNGWIAKLKLGPLHASAMIILGWKCNDNIRMEYQKLQAIDKNLKLSHSQTLMWDCKQNFIHVNYVGFTCVIIPRFRQSQGGTTLFCRQLYRSVSLSYNTTWCHIFPNYLFCKSGGTTNMKVKYIRRTILIVIMWPSIYRQIYGLHRLRFNTSHQISHCEQKMEIPCRS